MRTQRTVDAQRAQIPLSQRLKRPYVTLGQRAKHKKCIVLGQAQALAAVGIDMWSLAGNREFSAKCAVISEPTHNRVWATGRSGSSRRGRTMSWAFLQDEGIRNSARGDGPGAPVSFEWQQGLIEVGGMLLVFFSALCGSRRREAGRDAIIGCGGKPGFRGDHGGAGRKRAVLSWKRSASSYWMKSRFTRLAVS